MNLVHKVMRATLVMMLSLTAAISQAEPVRDSYSSLELVSEVSSVKPGDVFTLGLIVKPDAGWHNYWMNPGEAGKNMTIRWKDLAEGTEIADFVYAVPHIVAMGDIVTYGYSEENVITMDVSVPAGYTGDSLTLTGKASYLVCDDANCVPQSASLSITLPIGNGAIDAGNAETFKSARDHQPEVVDWNAAFYISEDNATVTYEVAFPEKGATNIYLWPATEKLIKHTNTQPSISVKDGVLTAPLEAMDSLAKKLERDAGKAPEKRKYERSALLLTYTDANGNEQAKFVADAPRVDGAGTVKAAAVASTGGSDSEDDMGLLYALGAAFLGGLILNLMPCVLPVLSLKMLSLSKMGESHPREVRSSGIFYTVGVVLSFLALAAVVIGIKSAGEAASWGFQMQNPIVVLSLVLLMTLIGMNLLGAFEFGTSMMNVGSNLTNEGDAHSKKSSFWTGVLAVVVATPCTAPFMAGALGYAFTQPVAVSLLIFVFLGLGLAFPYLLIAFVPGARRIVPNPGPWMSVFKTALAFPMFGTAIWLIWVMGDKDAMLWTMAAALTIALAAWAWGKVPMANKPNAWRVTAAIFVLALYYPFATAIDRKEESITAREVAKAEKTETLKTINALRSALKEAIDNGGKVTGDGAALLEQTHGAHSAEMPYSEQELMAMLSEGKEVFAYFTADWCVSCKVNEKASLHKDETLKFFADNNIHVMVGDNTDLDEEINRIIELYKHPGVPLYLYFKPGDSLQDGRKLPQLLPSPGVLINSIKEYRG
ncbi:cytochrome c biogenesis protein CcdA [Porticoccaceae bacterium LTM1]|nr:cytochrome c biogenesis protein CcdA [Porticoccaceae bacterium LTM1]